MKAEDVKRKARFKVGQVVVLNCTFYQNERKSEQYQQIIDVWPWREYKPQPWGYTFANGDKCNQKYLRPLTAKEKGMNS